MKGQVTASLTATPKRFSLSFDGVNAPGLAFEQLDALATPAVQADVTGAWRASSGGHTVNWTVGNDGVMTGSMAGTDCTFKGRITAMGSANAYHAQFEHRCTKSSGDYYNTSFTGIAVRQKNDMIVFAAQGNHQVAVARFSR